MTTNNALTVHDLISLGEIARAAQQSAHITYLDESGDIVKGTARAIVKDPARPYFLGHGDDVRDAYLWVTTLNGFETFPSVRHLAKMSSEGGFVIES